MGLFDFLGGGGGESGGGGISMEDAPDVATLLGFGDSAGLGGAAAGALQSYSGGGGGGGGGGGVKLSGGLQTYQGVKGELSVSYASRQEAGYPQTVSSILDQAQNTIGRRVSARALRYAAKQYGAEGAAQIFGLGLEDIGFLLAAPAPRRGRGVTARQLRNVGRVLRVFGGMRKQLDKYVHRSHAVTPTHHQLAHKGKR